MNITTRAAYIEYVKAKRGLRITAYMGPDGGWFIGYRHPSSEGETCSAAQAEKWLVEDLGGEK